MRNTCYDSFSSCYLCHSLYTCLFAVCSVEQGEEEIEGGREPHCPGPGGRRDVVFARCFTHAPAAAQWAWAPCKPQGRSNSVHWAVSLVCWSRRDPNTLSGFHGSSKTEGVFMEGFPPCRYWRNCEPPFPRDCQKMSLWNNPLFTLVLIKRPHLYSSLSKHLPIPTWRVFLAECISSNSCWGHAWHYYGSKKEIGVIAHLLSEAVIERKISLVDRTYVVIKMFY